MTQLSDNQMVVLKDFVRHKDLLYQALELFMAEEVEKARKACTAAMATVPRDPETASDFASKAEALERFLPKLEVFAKSL